MRHAPSRTLDEPLPMTFTQLERSVKAFSSHPVGLDKGITFSSLPIIEDAYVPSTISTQRTSTTKKKATVGSAVEEVVVDPASSVYKVPEFSSLGRAFRSSSECALTENEMEYVVTCTKHIFDSHVVLQFSVLNTIDDQRLKDVTVHVEIDDEEAYVVDTHIPAQLARYGEPTNCFVSLRKLGDPVPCSVQCELHFKVIQVDPTTGEIEGDEEVNDICSTVYFHYCPMIQILLLMLGI